MIAEIAMRHAIRAVTRRQSGSWAAADEADLQAWLLAAPEHREAYEKVARTWEAAGELKAAYRPAANETYVDVADPADAPGSYFPRRWVLAVAATVLIVVVCVPVWQRAARWWNPPQIELSTVKGQPKTFVLDDGTNVVMDADSALTVAISPLRRHIFLTRGEALFNVSHDASRPFEVVTASGRVQDLGTRFDIEVLLQSTHVSVLEGRVGVWAAGGQTLLVAGQVGGYDSDGGLLSTRSFREETTRWSEGQRHFDQEPLGDVLERIARYHDVKFVFADSRLPALRVSGTFRTDDLQLFLRTLAKALPVEARSLDAERIEITHAP